jgi:rubredoxin
MIITFGTHNGKRFEDVPEKYLCWICAAWKGGTKATVAGKTPFKPSDSAYLEAKRILKIKGYDTKGIWPTKESEEYED